MIEEKPKQTRRKKVKCKNNHDIAVVGRTPSGNCKKCQSDYYRKRWDFIRRNFK
jgi:hypothetical protein